MKITSACRIVVATAFAFAVMPLEAQEKSVSQKTAEVWNKTKATTKNVSRKVAKTTRDTVNRVEAAVREPDADARKVEVKVNDKGVQMPKSLSAGKTAFVVTNTGKEAHNFEIEGSGMEKSFWFALGPNQTKTMQVDLRPGTYDASAPLKRTAAKSRRCG
jgi:iron uptake system EfeUOB component EfeO/EfeM